MTEGTPLECVHLSSDVYTACLNHALTTEQEEVMGLLIGEVEKDSGILKITAMLILRRSDKRKDRVEISPEQLMAATAYAEELSKDADHPVRVVGWYHSHPHITVFPSHVDVRTQGLYQMMDATFVGFIFSVFSEDKATLQNEIRVTCFQSLKDGAEDKQVEVPFHIIPTETTSQPCIKALVDMSNILYEEECDAFQKHTPNNSTDPLTNFHNSSVFAKNVCHVTEVVSLSLLTSMQQQQRCNDALANIKDSDVNDFLEEQGFS